MIGQSTVGPVNPINSHLKTSQEAAQAAGAPLHHLTTLEPTLEDTSPPPWSQLLPPHWTPHHQRSWLLKILKSQGADSWRKSIGQSSNSWRWSTCQSPSMQFKQLVKVQTHEDGQLVKVQASWRWSTCQSPSMQFEHSNLNSKWPAKERGDHSSKPLPPSSPLFM